jgi:putative transposase
VGHRKIAWLCGHDGVQVSDSTCLRVLRDSGLVLPVDYVRERRDLAKARREVFVTIPTRRNRVWQRTPAARSTTCSATVCSMTSPACTPAS